MRWRRDLKLRALHLTNVRRFTGKHAAITGIGEGITVVCESNEFGKSTFFDALHALFFEKFSSSARPVKSLQPYAGGSVEIAVEVETDQGAFRIEKKFLARKMARIVRLSDIAVIAQDDEAERWIGKMLGAPADGPAGLLWVRQGFVGLEPDAKTEKEKLVETRRDLMSSVAGEIDAMTGGRRMDRIMRQLADDLAEIATKTGRKSGPWKIASDEVEVLEKEVVPLAAQVANLDGAIVERKEKERLLVRLDDPDAALRRNLAIQNAQAAFEESRAHAGLVAAAEKELENASLKERAARSDLDALLAAFAALQKAEAEIKTTRTKAVDAADWVSDLKLKLDAATTAEETARTSLAQSRTVLDLARKQIEARRARELATQLGVRMAAVTDARERLMAAQARVRASAATPEWLARAEAIAADAARAEAVLQAQSATVQAEYLGTVKLSMKGKPLPAGEIVVLDGTTRLELPGIGFLTITAPAQPETALATLAKVRSARDTCLAEAGAASINAARRLASERAEAVRQSELAAASLAALAPEGIAALQAAKADADFAAADANDDPLPLLPDLQADVAKAELVLEQIAQVRRAAETDHGTARETAVRLTAALETATETLDQAIRAAGPAETSEVRKSDLLRALAQASQTRTDALSRHAELIATAPDPATAEAELRRATDAAAQVTTQRQQVAERVAVLSAEIRTLAGNSIEERLEEMQGRLDASRAAEVRFARRASALIRLQAALTAERGAAQDAYFGPVQQELKPLLSILHRDAALTFDGDSLLPTGLTRGQAEETLENLSGGTREQIAILTRLAFGRLFARQGRHMPIVLDDALVYSDDDRIIKMFTALTRVAQDQQIIVFSCRQLAFQDLGGVRPKVEITDA